MLLVIVPIFKDSLSQLEIKDEELNPLTAVVFNMSAWLIENGLTLLYIVVLAVALIFVVLKTEKGKYYFDVFKYKCPIINTVQINMVASKFTKSTGLLLASGMNLVDALEVVKNLLGNRYASKVFEHVIEDVRRGAALTFAMENYKMFPQMLIQMMSTGEKTGGIEEVLMRSINFFDSQVETSLLRVTGVLQPLMLIMMGGVIGVMFIAIYSPMLSIMTKDFTSSVPAVSQEVLMLADKVRRLFP